MKAPKCCGRWMKLICVLEKYFCGGRHVYSHHYQCKKCGKVEDE